MRGVQRAFGVNRREASRKKAAAPARLQLPFILPLQTRRA